MTQNRTTDDRPTAHPRAVQAYAACTEAAMRAAHDALGLVMQHETVDRVLVSADFRRYLAEATCAVLGLGDEARQLERLMEGFVDVDPELAGAAWRLPDAATP